MTSRTSKTKKPVIHRPLISPSLTSLVSSFTQTSTGSSGSGSTITQESVGKTRHRVHRKSEKRLQGQTKRLSRKETSHEPLAQSDKLNVFAYMEEEAEDDEDEAERGAVKHGENTTGHNMSRRNDVEHMIPPAAPMSPTSAIHPFAFEDNRHVPSARAPSITSFHSDSGISVRGVSPERSPVFGHKKSSSRNSIHKNVALTRTKSISSTSSFSSSKSMSEQLDSPESFYIKAQPKPLPISQASQQVLLKPKRQAEAIPAKRGYDFLASRLSSTDQERTKPIYRRFETLNNRVLLIMQDDIAVIEKDLAMVDQHIADLEGPFSSPVSRRSELRGPTPSQAHRMQLCSMLITKLTQYNRTLASYQSVAQMPTTSKDQVKVYKELLEQHEPLVSSETAFLDEITDLVTVSATSGLKSHQQKISYELGAALLFLLLAFKLIPSFLGRMILGGFLVGTLAWSGRLPVDEDAIGGVLCRRVGMYATAVFILSLAVG